MKRSRRCSLTAAALAMMISMLAAMPTGAQVARHRSIDARERRQQARLRQGERSGELTRREADRLEAREARIRTDEAYARRSGGKFTRAERRRIQHRLNRTSRAIYRQKHDAQEQH